MEEVEDLNVKVRHLWNERIQIQGNLLSIADLSLDVLECYALWAVVFSECLEA